MKNRPVGSWLARERAALIHSVVVEEVAEFFKAIAEGKRPRRPCAWCGRKFYPRQRWHFFDTTACRRAWYAGQFKPRD